MPKRIRVGFKRLTGARGTFALTGRAATLSYVPSAGPKTLTAAKGAFNWAGKSATLAGPSSAAAYAVLTKTSMDFTKVIILGDWVKTGDVATYLRWQDVTRWSTNSASVWVRCVNQVSTSSLTPFSGSSYSLTVDGVVVHTQAVTAGVTTGYTATFDITGMSQGWKYLSLTGLTGVEKTTGWWVYRVSGAVVAQPFIPVIHASYETTITNQGGGSTAVVSGKVYASFGPKAYPLPRRDKYEAFSTAITRQQMHYEQLAPSRGSDIHRPNVSVEGIVSTFDIQSYELGDFIAAKPRGLALLDGPRGVGNMQFITHVSLATAAPGGVKRNSVYVLDAWRVCKVKEDGTVTTLAGWRHTVAAGMAGHHGDPAPGRDLTLELVGDWSAIPAARHGFHELWGMAWDARTLPTDTGAAPIASENWEQPHLVGPVMFVTDSQNNRVCKLQFAAASRAPPVVTEFITGLLDPWDIIFDTASIYVSERKSHRIAEYNATTGAFVRVVVSGAALATVDADRFVTRTASLATIQAEACVAPEGLFKLTTDRWLWFGSLAMSQVRRVNLDTAALEVMANVPTDGNTRWVKIAVSDGTFGPMNTVFTWGWTNGQQGMCWAYLPAGFTYSGTGDRWWTFYELADPANESSGHWASNAYASAGTVGMGRLVQGGAGELLGSISKRQSWDKVLTAAARTGATQYKHDGYSMAYGYAGYGFFANLELPWGVSTNIDAYLEENEHAHPPSWVSSTVGVATLVPMANTLQDVFVATGAQNPGGAGSQKFTDFSGGVYNRYYGRLGAHVIHGGGHAATNDNSVFIADYDTLTFSRIAGPTVLADTTAYNTAITNGGFADDGNVNPRELAPGVPGSAHTDDCLMILPPSMCGDLKGALIRPVASAIGHADTVSRSTGWSHVLTMTTPAWSRWSTNSCTNWGVGGACVHDTLRNRIWPLVSGNNDYTRYLDLATKTWSNTAATVGSVTGYPDMVYGAYEPRRDIVIVGMNEQTAPADLNVYWFHANKNGTDRTVATFTGGPLPPASYGTGVMLYVHELERLVYYTQATPDSYYLIDVPIDPNSAWAVTTKAITGAYKPSLLTNPVPAGSMYHRMDYSPMMKSLLWVTGASAASSSNFGGQIIAIRIVA